MSNDGVRCSLQLTGGPLPQKCEVQSSGWRTEGKAWKTKTGKGCWKARITSKERMSLLNVDPFIYNDSKLMQIKSYG